MAFSVSLVEKIEAIRREPEAVRMRYVIGCVSVAMVFVIGIWLLSVHESISKTAADIPDAIEQSKKDIGGQSAPSLNELFEQSAPLRIEEKKVEGGQFFEQQLSGRETVQPGETAPPAPKNQ